MEVLFVIWAGIIPLVPLIGVQLFKQRCDKRKAAVPRLLIRKHKKVSKINVFKGREHGTKSKNLILTGTKGADFSHQRPFPVPTP